MTGIDTAFGRAMVAQAHKAVKTAFPGVNLVKDAWVWRAGRNHWEFHGPDKFYWHGSASDAFEARYKGWMAWLRSKGVGEEDA